MIAIYLELGDQLAEPYFMYFFFKKELELGIYL